MTTRNTLKQLIRARMKKTGESYTTARSKILISDTVLHRQLPDAAGKLKVVLAQPTLRTESIEGNLEALFAHEFMPDCDLLVLPELIGGNSSEQSYRTAICGLAKHLDCFVVGGSCYLTRHQQTVNAGIVANCEGDIVTHYEKLRPYGSEISSGITSGNKIGRFKVSGRSFSVLICSDLWFSNSFSDMSISPDVMLIPSFSITQRDEPNKPRQLWEHMLVARAAEYAAYVGVSDWAHSCEFDDGLSAAGVSGFANPRPEGNCFYEANQLNTFRSYTLDFTRLDAFRENRAARGFLRRHRDIATEQ